MTNKEYMKKLGFRLSKDVTPDERRRRIEEWKSLRIARTKPHDNSTRWKNESL